MIDEPLYCPACGVEIGPDHQNCDYDDSELPRAACYCDVCGIVPGEGKECHFYKRGGRRQGCEQ